MMNFGGPGKRLYPEDIGWWTTIPGKIICFVFGVMFVYFSGLALYVAITGCSYCH